jgi:3-oxoacyl-[acyl-carrier-protein] synthase-3
MIYAAFRSIGAYVPSKIMTNVDFEKLIDTSDEWITKRTGIKERRIASKDEATSDLGQKAAQIAIDRAGISKEDIDLIICATVTPDFLCMPSTACLIAAKLELPNIMAFDVSAACTGFVYALSVAKAFIESGAKKNVLIVGAEKYSAILNYTDRTTCFLFGDGAGAVLIEPCTDGYGVVDAMLHVDGSGRKHLFQAAGGSVQPASMETVLKRQHFIYQEGQKVFKFAVSRMADTAAEMMEKHHLTADDIAYLIPHQANLRIIDATGKRMGLTDDKVLINIAKYGNTSAVSIPLVLMDYEKQFKKGDTLIFAAFGAGFTWGAHYYKWAY